MVVEAGVRSAGFVALVGCPGRFSRLVVGFTLVVRPLETQYHFVPAINCRQPHSGPLAAPLGSLHLRELLSCELTFLKLP